MYASTNFLSLSELRNAVALCQPVVLWSPAMGVPAIEGRALVEGPWPGTVLQRCSTCAVHAHAHARTAARPGAQGLCAACPGTDKVTLRRPRGWHAEVMVRDMTIMAVY